MEKNKKLEKIYKKSYNVNIKYNFNRIDNKQKGRKI